jgi:hypothetical protein
MSARIGGLVAALLLLAGCEGLPDGAAAPVDPNGTPVAPGTPAADGDVGSFSMNLTLGGALQINEVSYDLSGNGFHKTGSLNVAGSSSLSVVIGPIPVGTGYVVQLTAQDAAHKLTGCAGSASFDIRSATTTQVPVHLTCHEVPAPAPAAVPVPRWATFMITALLLSLGAAALRRRDQLGRSSNT